MPRLLCRLERRKGLCVRREELGGQSRPVAGVPPASLIQTFKLSLFKHANLVPRLLCRLERRKGLCVRGQELGGQSRPVPGVPSAERARETPTGGRQPDEPTTELPKGPGFWRGG
jgi:hypothetical protein